MRVIKFRGKRIDNGKWIYGDLLTSNGTECEISDWNTVDYSRHDVFIETVGQFTGLLDKNGKEIYEGDIIKISKHEIQGIIKWDNHRLCFLCEWTNMHTAGDIGYLVNCCLLEVVGTVLDNPELLKGGGK